MPKPPPPSDYQAALDYFRSRLPLTSDEFDTLSDDVKDQAFTVAGVNQLSIVSDVWTALDHAIADGTSFGDFKLAVSEKLADAWGDENGGYRIEGTYRTWIQKSYGAGRYETMTDPDVKEARPYWQFVGVEDDRQTKEICFPCNDVVRPADDPWWYTHNPPLHSQCRSTTITLTPEQAAALGVDDAGPDAEPQDGFGGPPTVAWDPDLSRYPLPLVARYLAKTGS